MSKYAIVETGSKQYWVEPNSVLEVEKLNVEEDAKEVELKSVLLIKDGDLVKVGQPLVENASILCECLGDMRGKKVISFKFRKRKASRKIRGHRQELTQLRVKDIKF